MSTLEASQSSQKGKGDGYKPKQLSELREEAEYTQRTLLEYLLKLTIILSKILTACLLISM